MDDSRCKNRVRNVNFTPGERSHLITLVKQDLNVIESKQKDNTCSFKKSEAWRKIAEEIAQKYPTKIVRRPFDYKECWRRMKNRAKKHYHQKNDEQPESLDPDYNIDSNEETSRILECIPTSELLALMDPGAADQDSTDMMPFGPDAVPLSMDCENLSDICVQNSECADDVCAVKTESVYSIDHQESDASSSHSLQNQVEPQQQSAEEVSMDNFPQTMKRKELHSSPSSFPQPKSARRGSLTKTMGFDSYSVQPVPGSLIQNDHSHTNSVSCRTWNGDLPVQSVEVQTSEHSSAHHQRELVMMEEEHKEKMNLLKLQKHAEQERLLAFQAKKEYYLERRRKLLD